MRLVTFRHRCRTPRRRRHRQRDRRPHSADSASRRCARCWRRSRDGALGVQATNADVVPRRCRVASTGSRPRARHRRRAEHAKPCRRSRRVAGTEPEAPEYPRLFLRSPVSQVGHGGPLWIPRVLAPPRLRRRAGSRHRPARAIPQRGNRARRGRRLRLLQRRQRARLPVTHQPVHGREEFPAHRRVRTLVGHA